MAYTDQFVIVSHGDGNGVATTAGRVLYYGSKRPFNLLGWGVVVTSAQTRGTSPTDPVIAVRKNGTNLDSFTLTTPQITTAGSVVERSALLRSPTSPDATFTPVRFGAGDRLEIQVTTAENAGTGGTAAKYQFFVIVE